MDKKIERFYDLECWRKAYDLTLIIYKLTYSFPKNEMFGLTSQMRRAGSSVAANIAEGFSRYHYKDKAKFYYQARGSIAEVQTFLLLSKDLGYINLDECKKRREEFNTLNKLINGLIRSVKKQK